MVSTADTYPLFGVLFTLLSSVMVWGAGRAAINTKTSGYQVAWKATAKMIGWMPVAVTAGLMLMLFTMSTEVNSVPLFMTARVVESLIPLSIGIQAGFLLSPDDEPALETFLACPRHVTWLLLERIAVLWMFQGLIALAGTLLVMRITGETDFMAVVFQWLPPAVFLTGVGVYTTLRSRQAVFGVLIAGLTWFAFCFFAEAFVPGFPTFDLLDRLQPFLWPVNLYLKSGAMTDAEYLFNRAFIVIAGFNLILLSINLLRSEERLLLGTDAKVSS